MTAAMHAPLAAAGRPASAILREPLFAAAAVVLLLMTLPTAAAMLLDDRLYRGIESWTKPFKFQLAIALYLGTLSFYARWLPAGTTERRWYRIYAAIVVAAIAYEIVVISGAVALGTGSHFNEATPLSTTLYRLMGALAVVLTSASLVYGVLIARSDRPRDPALKAGLVLGLVLTFALTLVFAGALSANGGHFVPGGDSDIGGLWLMGWSREVGDLRVAHFFGTHAMHAVPLAGFVAGRTLARRPAMAATCGFALFYTGFCAATFAQALAGRPFLPALG